MGRYAEALDFDTDDLVMVEQDLEGARVRFEHVANSSTALAHEARSIAETCHKLIDDTEFELRQASGDDVAKEALEAVTDRVRNLVPWLVNRRLMTAADAGQERGMRQ